MPMRTISPEEMGEEPKGLINIRIIPPEQIKNKKIEHDKEREKGFRPNILSDKSKKVYEFYIQKLMEYANKTKYDEIIQKDLIDYWASIKDVENGTKRLIKQALRFQFPKLDFSEMLVGKIKRKIPDVLTIEEVQFLIEMCQNEKHQLLIKMLYSTGMRLSEVRNLKYEDININEDLIKVIKGKGSKERFVQLASMLKEELSDLKGKHSPSDYIFSVAGHKMSERAIQDAITKAVDNCGFDKHIHVHSLRHSFATHLYEDGITLEIIQKLLGHESINTTLIYAHISNKKIKGIQSPLDKLNF